ncbi:MAG: hypothetical protein ACXVQQ_07925, partial [Gaiellaceae bacterium]
MLDRELREFAQTPDRYTYISGDVQRFADERVCVIQGSVWAGVAGVRVGADDVEALIEEVRALVPPEKLTTWWLDPDTRPSGLDERLLALGFREPRDRGGVLHALACVEEPPVGPDDVAVTRVETFDDHVAAVEVMWDAFATPQERRD